MSSLSSNQKIIGGAIVGLAAVALFKLKPDTPASNSPAPALKAKVAAPDAPQVLMAELEKSASKQKLDQIRKSYNLMNAIGVQIIPSQVRAQHLEMKVQIQTPSASCNIGEFDLIKNLVENLADKNFLLSIDDEKASSGSKPLFAQRLSVLEISTNPTLIATLPHQEEGRGFTLSLCANDSKATSCVQKKLLKPNDWQDEMASTKAHDFLFYTQFFVVKQGVAYLAPTHKYDEASLKTLRARLKPILADFSSFDAFVPKLRALSPMPARVTKKGLDINLPVRAPGC